MTDNTQLLSEALLANEGLLLVVTGAGVSRASGIATFRGSEPEAVWKVSDIEMATAAFFHADPVAQWRWYLERFRALAAARPNPAHTALAAIERWQLDRDGDFLLVTQNIDTLHEEAGSDRLIKVHGSSDRVRCSSPGCRLGAPAGSLARADVDLTAFEADPGEATLPRCPDCESPLRAHVLFFDEYYTEHIDYQFSAVQEGAASAGCVLFAGTSFSVGVTDLALNAALRRGAPVFAIDPAGQRAPVGGGSVRTLTAEAETLLPAVCERLGAR